MKENTPQAVQAAHELLRWLIPQLDKFPRSRRFTLGERLEVVLLEVFELAVEAAFTHNKRAALHKANLRLEVVKHLWRAGGERTVRQPARDPQPEQQPWLPSRLFYL
jgi:hypothetical protein